MPKDTVIMISQGIFYKMRKDSKVSERFREKSVKLYFYMWRHPSDVVLNLILNLVLNLRPEYRAFAQKVLGNYSPIHQWKKVA